MIEPKRVVVHGGLSPHDVNISVGDVDWTRHIAGLTIEMWPTELPRVTITLDTDSLDVDLFGMIDYPLADVLRGVLSHAEADKTFAAQIESAAAESTPKGLGGSRGDTAIGFLRGLIDTLNNLDV